MFLHVFKSAFTCLKRKLVFSSTYRSSSSISLYLMFCACILLWRGSFLLAYVPLLFVYRDSMHNYCISDPPKWVLPITEHFQIFSPECPDGRCHFNFNKMSLNLLFCQYLHLIPKCGICCNINKFGDTILLRKLILWDDV